MENKCLNVGGQALIEGVMMKAPGKKAISIRMADGSIRTKTWEAKSNFMKKIGKIPIIRGVFVLINSMVEGSKDLNYSASLYEEGVSEDDQEESKFYNFLNKIFGKYTDEVLTTFTYIVAFALGILLFSYVPAFIAKLFNRGNYIIVSMIEGVIKIAVLVLYMYLVSKQKDIHRVFMYHGSEHKSVFAYEKGLDLTVENVRKMSRFHPRCGTNFILVVLIVSIFINSFINISEPFKRTVIKLLLFPVVSGLSYEVIRLAGKHPNFITTALIYPGLLLQRITTQEPDDSMIEVAIESLKAALGIDEKNEELKNCNDEESDSKKIEGVAISSDNSSACLAK